MRDMKIIVLMVSLLCMGLILAPVEVELTWAPVQAQSFCPGITELKLSPIASSQQKLTINSTTVAITLTAPRGALMAVATVETDSIRYADDGTAPNGGTGVGMLVQANSSFLICGGGSMNNLKMVKITNNATVTISYYGTVPR